MLAKIGAEATNTIKATSDFDVRLESVLSDENPTASSFLLGSLPRLSDVVNPAGMAKPVLLSFAQHHMGHRTRPVWA